MKAQIGSSGVDRSPRVEQLEVVENLGDRKLSLQQFGQTVARPIPSHAGQYHGSHFGGDARSGHEPFQRRKPYRVLQIKEPSRGPPDAADHISHRPLTKCSPGISKRLEQQTPVSWFEVRVPHLDARLDLKAFPDGFGDKSGRKGDCVEGLHAYRASERRSSMAREQPLGSAPSTLPATRRPPSASRVPKSSVKTAITDPAFARS